MSFRIFTTLLLATSLAFTGCDKESEPENELIGSWTFADPHGGPGYETFSFYEDNVVKVVGGGDNEEYNWDGTYQFHNPELTVQLHTEVRGYLVNDTALSLKFPQRPSAIYIRD